MSVCLAYRPKRFVTNNKKRDMNPIPPRLKFWIEKCKNELTVKNFYFEIYFFSKNTKLEDLVAEPVFIICGRTCGDIH